MAKRPNRTVVDSAKDAEASSFAQCVSVFSLLPVELASEAARLAETRAFKFPAAEVS